MFERYEVSARRCIFFARYEARNTGTGFVEAPHLLLALAREDGKMLRVEGRVVSRESAAIVVGSVRSGVWTVAGRGVSVRGFCSRLRCHAGSIRPRTGTARAHNNPAVQMACRRAADFRRRRDVTPSVNIRTMEALTVLTASSANGVVICVLPFALFR